MVSEVRDQHRTSNVCAKRPLPRVGQVYRSGTSRSRYSIARLGAQPGADTAIPMPTKVAIAIGHIKLFDGWINASTPKKAKAQTAPVTKAAILDGVQFDHLAESP